MNCQPGDLAIVVDDEPGCEKNIGRLVQVEGVCLWDLPDGPWWIVRPLGPARWMCYSPELDRGVATIHKTTKISIEDRCLRPVSGLPLEEAVKQSRPIQVSKTIKKEA